jgi:hypothetical protein
VEDFFRHRLASSVPLARFLHFRLFEYGEFFKNNRQPWFHATPERPRTATPSAGLDRYPVDEEMKMLGKAYDGRVTLLFLARFEPGALERESPAEKLVKKAAIAHGVHFVSLRERFQDLAGAGRAPYGFPNTDFNKGHWNKYGHAAGAEILMQEYKRIRNDIH